MECKKNNNFLAFSVLRIFIDLAMKNIKRIAVKNIKRIHGSEISNLCFCQILKNVNEVKKIIISKLLMSEDSSSI